MKFEQAVEIVLKHEGGYVNHPNDPGGETKFGISKRSYPEVDIFNLTIDQAKEIYKRDYWEKIKADKLPKEIRLVCFDFAVNSGVHRCATLLQNLAGVAEDGIIGTQTIKAIYELDPKELLGEILIERQHFYIINRNWPSFGAGWSKRLMDIAIKSMELHCE